MQVDGDFLEGSWRPLGGQSGADRGQTGVLERQRVTHLIAGYLVVQGSYFGGSRILSLLLSCLSPGCLAVGQEMRPHQLAGGRLLRGGDLRVRRGLELATEERIAKWAILEEALTPFFDDKKNRRHTARSRDGHDISDSESGLELTAWDRTATAPLLSVSLAAASGAWGSDCAGTSSSWPWAPLAAGSGCLWAADGRMATWTRWRQPADRAAGYELLLDRKSVV